MLLERLKESRRRELDEKVRRRLIREGYDVHVNPAANLLPPDLANLYPSWLGVRESEKVIVEVVGRERDVDKDRVGALAAALHHRPGWRFELVLGDIEDEYTDPWSIEDIEDRVDKAVHLLRSGQEEAGLLLLWAAAESAGRLLIDLEAVDLRSWEGQALFAHLVQQGHLSQEDRVRVDDARQARNRLAHGLHAHVDVDGVGEELAGVVRRLLDEVKLNSADRAPG